ncbi:MAG: hypothetical protein C1941_08770 [Prosthecochloris sp.]|nr:hypothetical protein [Prosthecochloris sp.]
MGLSVMLHLLRYRELAVVHYSGVPCALHLQHAQQSLNLGTSYQHFIHSYQHYRTRHTAVMTS